MATSDGGRFGRFLYSTKNIVGCVCAVGGPVLAAAGVINPLLGLGLVAPLYAIGALVAPARRPVNLAAGTDPADVRRSLSEIQRRIRGRVPPEIAARVDHIATSITESLPKAEGLGASSQDLFVLVRTATDYLPTSLQAYLDLPRAYADRHVVADGKTALGLLTDQLDLLASKMDDVADAIHRSDADKLVANGRFLAEKFGGKGLDLRGGPGSGAGSGGTQP